MNANEMLIIVMSGLTIVAFMIAINTHGPVRITFSFGLATLLLLCTSITIYHYSSQKRIDIKLDELKALASEEKRGEERILSHSNSTQKTEKNRSGIAKELIAVIGEGTTCARFLMNKELQDESVELETLVGRASEARNQTEQIKNDFEKLTLSDNSFKDPVVMIKNGIQSLREASQYYLQYYYSECPDQESTREQMLRTKARTALENFNKAGSLIASMEKQSSF